MTAGPQDAADAERPPGQSELDLGVVPTGDDRVDQALRSLEQLVGRPVEDHPAVYEAVHQQLQAALVADAGPPED